MAQNKWNALDIINSDNWDKSKWLSFFQDRLGKMEGKRSPFDWDSQQGTWIWTNADTQVNAVSFYDNDGSLQVNIPLEKTLKEIYMGRTDGKMTYDIVPDWQANVEELQPSKYALGFFLDWNWKDNFWKENSRFRDLKAHYGSWIYFTGIRKYTDFRYELKDDADIEDNENILNKNNFNKIENTTWFLFPQCIHPRDFYIDDNAYWCPDVQKAEDCIMKETVTATQLEIRYWKNKDFNLSGVQYSTDPSPKNKNDTATDLRTIVLYHYFHRETKVHLIVANNAHLVYEGRNLNNDWKLPFENIQHYTNQNRFRWEGIPERVAYLKAYKSEIFQDILTGAEMASWVNLLTWNDDEIGQDWTVWGRGLNLWRTTGWADRVQPINTNINLGYFTAVLDVLEKQITIDSWINAQEQYEAQSDKVGIVEIQEANKAIRNKSVDENYNIGLDSILTMTLDRIKQYAPALLSEKVMSEDWKTVISRNFPKIRIDNFDVKQKKATKTKPWEIKITENIWKYGYFELEKGVVQWVWVKIITASTNSVLPILERQKVTEYMNNLTSLANVAALDQTWEMMTKLKEWTRFDELLQWMWDAYSYDINWLKANTEKDKIAKDNLEKIKNLQDVLTINPEQNAWQTAWLPTEWQTSIPTGGEQPPEGWAWPLPPVL